MCMLMSLRAGERARARDSERERMRERERELTMLYCFRSPCKTVDYTELFMTDCIC